MLTMGHRRVRSRQRVAAPARQPPFRQEERTGGCRRGAGSQAPSHNAWRKTFLRGRPSVGEVLQSLPPAEDPWSLGEPLASPLPHWRRPWFLVTVNGGRGWCKAGPSSAILSKARCL